MRMETANDMHSGTDQTRTERARVINRSQRTLASIEMAAHGTEPREMASIASLKHLAALLAEAVDALRASPVPLTEDGVDFYTEVRRFEIALITRALRRTRGSQCKAASLLNLKRTTLNSKIKTYQITLAE
jgi:transcriptional regulator with PAS, ATPase and Fis domain